MKDNLSSLRPKAQLVAWGFQEDSLNQIQKDLPIRSKDTLRTVLSVYQKAWNCESIDIKTAFLQGDFLKRGVCETTHRSWL